MPVSFHTHSVLQEMEIGFGGMPVRVHGCQNHAPAQPSFAGALKNQSLVTATFLEGTPSWTPDIYERV